MTRWTAKDKAAVIHLMREGKITLATLALYEVSLEEYAAWAAAFDEHGIDALKATKLQKFRAIPRRPRVRRKIAAE